LSRSPAARRPARNVAHGACGSAATARFLVQTDVELQPLAVAKLLRANLQKENPQLVILGKTGDRDDCNQTGTDLAARCRLVAGDVRFRGQNLTLRTQSAESRAK